MDESFDRLEEKVQRAAELVTQLRARNRELEEDLARVRRQLAEGERKLTRLQQERAGGASDAREHDALGQEVKTLRKEREEIRQRISKLIELLEGLE